MNMIQINKIREGVENIIIPANYKGKYGQMEINKDRNQEAYSIGILLLNN